MRGAPKQTQAFRGSPEPTEARIQGEAVAWFRKEYPTLGALLFMIKNDGRKNPIQGSRDLALGLVPGTPDLFLAVPYKGKPGLFLEIKRSDGVISRDQVLQVERLQSQGYQVQIVWSLGEFKAVVINYLGKNGDWS